MDILQFLSAADGERFDGGKLILTLTFECPPVIDDSVAFQALQLFALCLVTEAKNGIWGATGIVNDDE